MRTGTRPWRSYKRSKRWDRQLDPVLVRFWPALSVKVLAEKFGMSIEGIRSQARRLGLPMRRELKVVMASQRDVDDESAADRFV